MLSQVTRIPLLSFLPFVTVHLRALHSPSLFLSLSLSFFLSHSLSLALSLSLSRTSESKRNVYENMPFRVLPVVVIDPNRNFVGLLVDSVHSLYTHTKRFVDTLRNRWNRIIPLRRSEPKRMPKSFRKIFEFLL